MGVKQPRVYNIKLEFHIKHSKETFEFLRAEQERLHQLLLSGDKTHEAWARERITAIQEQILSPNTQKVSDEIKREVEKLDADIDAIEAE